jgi:hypothetical protein
MGVSGSGPLEAPHAVHHEHAFGHLKGGKVVAAGPLSSVGTDPLSWRFLTWLAPDHQEDWLTIRINDENITNQELNVNHKNPSRSLAVRRVDRAFGAVNGIRVEKLHRNAATPVGCQHLFENQIEAAGRKDRLITNLFAIA